jgi:hypothetical protein
MAYFRRKIKKFLWDDSKKREEIVCGDRIGLSFASIQTAKKEIGGEDDNYCRQYVLPIAMDRYTFVNPIFFGSCSRGGDSE